MAYVFSAACLALAVTHTDKHISALVVWAVLTYQDGELLRGLCQDRGQIKVSCRHPCGHLNGWAAVCLSLMLLLWCRYLQHSEHQAVTVLYPEWPVCFFSVAIVCLTFLCENENCDAKMIISTNGESYHIRSICEKKIAFLTMSCSLAPLRTCV